MWGKEATGKFPFTAERNSCRDANTEKRELYVACFREQSLTSQDPVIILRHTTCHYTIQGQEVKGEMSMNCRLHI